MRASAAVGFLVVLAAGVGPGRTDPPVGVVKVVKGEALVQRAGQSLPARDGMGLAEGDLLRTGPDGRLGVLLRDDTRLSLGPDSEIRIDRFAFAPAQGNLALVLRMLRGAATYVSGKLAKLSPEAVRVETPVGIVGIRGTQFAARIEAP
ncbi:MAG: hypothetical protein DMD79_27215 [Candidatus Rokuibacteriota bacterium]|nr:MAG: hypothetical protein DMD79_27215 [Candidatus Rokubacteria bacterium]